MRPLLRWTMPIYIDKVNECVSDKYPLFFVEVGDVVVEVLVLGFVFSHENHHTLNGETVQILEVRPIAHVQVVQIVWQVVLNVVP